MNSLTAKPHYNDKARKTVMQFDRQITITTGASRNDLNWKPQLMTVAELYDRLRNPVRSTHICTCRNLSRTH